MLIKLSSFLSFSFSERIGMIYIYCDMRFIKMVHYYYYYQVGLACLSKFVKQIDIEHDYLSWFQIDEHVFGREIILGTVYVPPEASRYSNIEMFDEIESDLIQLYKENTSVCIMGDLNARTGTQSDVIYF